MRAPEVYFPFLKARRDFLQRRARRHKRPMSPPPPTASRRYSPPFLALLTTTRPHFALRRREEGEVSIGRRRRFLGPAGYTRRGGFSAAEWKNGEAGGVGGFVRREAREKWATAGNGQWRGST